MGASECFIYSKNPKYSVETLGEYLTKHKLFQGEYAPFWIVGMSVAVNDLVKNSVMIFGQEQTIDPLCLKKGQEALCVGHENFNDIRNCFPFHMRKSLVVIELWQLADMDYTKVWEDKPITINGKSYFAELINAEEYPQQKKPLDERIESAKARSDAQTVANEPIFLFEENKSGNRMGKPGDGNNVYYCNWLEVYSKSADGHPHQEKSILEFTERDHPSMEACKQLEAFYDEFRQKHPGRSVVVLELEYGSKKPISERMNDALGQYKARDEKPIGDER